MVKTYPFLMVYTQTSKMAPNMVPTITPTPTARARPAGNKYKDNIILRLSMID